MSFYPALVFPPDAEGLVGCLVPDLLINATGRNRDDALADALRSMDELLAEMAREGEPFPEPTPVEALESAGGLIVLLHARTSQAA